MFFPAVLLRLAEHLRQPAGASARTNSTSAPDRAACGPLMEKLPAPSTDPQCEGWPCFMTHVPSKQHGVGQMQWVDRNRCALRLHYETTEGHEEYRGQRSPAQRWRSSQVGMMVM